MNWGELLRIYTMIAAVSTVSLFVFASQFSGSDALLSVAVVAVGTIAFVSVILGALLAGTTYLSHGTTERAPTGRDSMDTYGEESSPD